MANSIEILLIEDNPGDADLVREALEDGMITNAMHHVRDGVEGLRFLRREGKYAECPKADLVLLDLNLPKRSGLEILNEIKTSPDLQSIPVIVLTSSGSPRDIAATYASHANCYVQKPVDVDEFLKALRLVGEFWLTVVRRP